VKVLYVTNVPSPYRVDFFSELSRYCDLTVIYELNFIAYRDSRWKTEREGNFKEIFLNAHTVRADTTCSFSVIKYLQSDYDIIVFMMYGDPTQLIGMEYLRFRGKKFILNLDGGFIPVHESVFKHWIKSHVIKAASICLSTGYRTSEFMHYYGAQRIFEIPFTSVWKSEVLLYEKIDPVKWKKKLGIGAKYMILSVGRFIHGKGYDILLKAARFLPEECVFYIIGGDITAKYRELLIKYQLHNIVFMDFMEKELLNEYYLAADCFVLPTRRDTWGLVVNEAMAKGLPIVTTNMCLAGCEMIEDGKNGYIVPVENVEVLAKRINVILNDLELQEQMRRNNLQKAQYYTIENMVKCHMDIFKKL
jgi:glycosyltransferase involved in cell wall biosynthesis